MHLKEAEQKEQDEAQGVNGPRLYERQATERPHEPTESQRGCNATTWERDYTERKDDKDVGVKGSKKREGVVKRRAF